MGHIHWDFVYHWLHFHLNWDFDKTGRGVELKRHFDHIWDIDINGLWFSCDLHWHLHYLYHLHWHFDYSLHEHFDRHFHHTIYVDCLFHCPLHHHFLWDFDDQLMIIKLIIEVKLNFLCLKITLFCLWIRLNLRNNIYWLFLFWYFFFRNHLYLHRHFVDGILFYSNFMYLFDHNFIGLPNDSFYLYNCLLLQHDFNRNLHYPINIHFHWP